jgi:hypothetical protein
MALPLTTRRFPLRADAVRPRLRIEKDMWKWITGRNKMSRPAVRRSRADAGRAACRGEPGRARARWHVTANLARRTACVHFSDRVRAPSFQCWAAYAGRQKRWLGN